MKRWGRTLFVLVCLAVWSGAEPPVTRGGETAPTAPPPKRFTLEFRDAELKDVLRLLGQESGLNILIGDEITGKISVSFKEVTLDQALASILQSFGYVWSMRDDIVVVSKKTMPEQYITPLHRGEEDAAGAAPQLFSMEFLDVDVRDVLHLLSQKSGKNIIVGEEIAGKVTVSFKEVSLDQALASISQSFGYAWSEENGVVLITKKPLPGKFISRAVQIHYLIETGLGDQSRTAAQLDQLVQSLKPLLTRPEAARSGNAAQTTGEKPEESKGGEGVAGGTSAVRSPDIEVKSEGRITFIPRINTLVITDLPDRVERIVELLRELDKPTPQIKIEARIVEVKDIYQKEMGIKWGGSYSADGAHGNATSYEFPNSVNISGTEGDGSYLVNLPASSSVAGVGISLGHIANILSLDLKLSAMEKMEKLKILSTPSVVTMQGKEAVFRVGEQLPFETSSTDTAGAKTTTVEFKDIVLQLRVVPSVLPEGRIILDLVLNKDTRGAEVILPDQKTYAIDTKSVTTRVLLRDGETGVIGGLYTQQEIGGGSQVPLLGRIPLLGWLFRSRAEDKTRNELLIFITPHIQQI